MVQGFSNVTGSPTRPNAISLNDVGVNPKSDVAEMLQKADKDNDGWLDINEVTAVLRELGHKRGQVRMLRFVVVSQLALLLLFAGVSFGLVWLVVDIHSNPIKEGIMVDKRTGEPIKVCIDIVWAVGPRSSFLLAGFICRYESAE
jgi:hypothetical protein